MALLLRFVVLDIGFRLAKKNQPSTSYFVLTFANNLSHPYFEQRLKCLVTLDDIIRSNSFSEEIKSLARKFQKMPAQRDQHWLNEWLRFKNMVVAAFQANSKAYLQFLPALGA